MDKPLCRFDLDKKLDTFVDLSGMYARNQIASMLPRGERYREMAKFESRVRKISNRIDELIVVFIQDNTLREVTYLPIYPLLKTNPIRQNIQTVRQVNKTEVEVQKEIECIIWIAFPPADTTQLSASVAVKTTEPQPQRV